MDEGKFSLIETDQLNRILDYFEKHKKTQEKLLEAIRDKIDQPLLINKAMSLDVDGWMLNSWEDSAKFNGVFERMSQLGFQSNIIGNYIRFQTGK